MEEWGFFVFLWFGMGIVGSVLGAIVEKVVAGFFLGFFLGPIGWIIVLLLPRDQESKKVPIAQKTEPEKRADRPERNLESNAYKIWLGKTYNIQKNELFEKYEYDENLFETLEEALSYVDQKDREREEAELKNSETASSFNSGEESGSGEGKGEGDATLLIVIGFTVLLFMALIVANA